MARVIMAMLTPSTITIRAIQLSTHGLRRARLLDWEMRPASVVMMFRFLLMVLFWCNEHAVISGLYFGRILVDDGKCDRGELVRNLLGGDADIDRLALHVAGCGNYRALSACQDHAINPFSLHRQLKIVIDLVENFQLITIQDGTVAL